MKRVPGIRGLLVLFVITTLCFSFSISFAGDSQVEGDTILFSLPEGKGIYSIRDDGSDLKQIVPFGWALAVSPDNKKIAFGEYYNEGIWIADIDGSNRKKITDFGAIPAWSPDGSMIVFSDYPNIALDRRIWIMNSDGSNKHKLTDIPGSYPKWSNSGKRIIFNGVNLKTYIINIDGTDLTHIARMYFASYTPDKSMIVYSGPKWHLVIINDDPGSPPYKLTETPGIYPCFSHNGSKVVFQGYKYASGIYVINTDGTGLVRIHDNGEYPACIN